MPSLTTSVKNSTISQITDGGDNNLQITTESSLGFFVIIFIIIVAVLLLILLITVVKWFIRERRLRELRHRLIPLYTFDPNDEDDWEAELLSQDQSIVAQKTQDYNSVSTVEDIDSSMGKRKLNL